MNATAPGSATPSVEFCARSDIGRVRIRNEDVLEVRPEHGWALLSDGMGGYRGGDVAAKTAVTAALRRLEYEADAGRVRATADVLESLANAASDANAEIHRVTLVRPELAGMGATLVAAVFLARHVVSMHIGDSRMYRLRAGLFEQLTRDHTMLQEQVDGGMMSAEDARRAPYRGMLTRGLGVGSMVEPEFGVHEAQPGDLFLLCSDGLTDMLDDCTIAQALEMGGPLEPRAERLVEMANLNGGRDNVSLIIARMLP
jgi:protein phosphatase